MKLRPLLLGLLLSLPALSVMPAQAQSVPGFATVERVYPVGVDGTKWKIKCTRKFVPAATGRPGFYDRQDRYEHDRPETFRKKRRHCKPVPRAAGRFVGYLARASENGRIFDQFVTEDVRPGDRIRLSPDARFVGYDKQARKIRPDKDWGDRYFPGYPYGARY